jgi:hypothetical protein
VNLTITTFLHPKLSDLEENQYVRHNFKWVMSIIDGAENNDLNKVGREEHQLV